MLFFALAALLAACGQAPVSQETSQLPTETVAVKPLYVTDTTLHDTDDPAIWINPTDPAKSLIVGTDKDEDGALYVFDLKGKIVNTVKGLKRPNNVDLEYGLMLGGKPTDIAVTTERLTHKLRVFRLPDMQPVDGGGLPVFEGEPEDKEFRDLMGVSLYKKPGTNEIYAIVGRKVGPATGYLWQYLLSDNGRGQVQAKLVRKFGTFSGKAEIEAIAVDDELGFVYYCDETVGIRKYYADPAKGDQELAFFGQQGFTQDHEGISIYDLGGGKGYLLVSDQQANSFRIFTREGDNTFLTSVKVSTNESDGSETVSIPLGPDFPHGLFVAMSDNKTFQLYRWEDIAGKALQLKK